MKKQRPNLILINNEKSINSKKAANKNSIIRENSTYINISPTQNYITDQVLKVLVNSTTEERKPLVNAIKIGILPGYDFDILDS
jgi:hypothetical protein